MQFLFIWIKHHFCFCFIYKWTLYNNIRYFHSFIYSIIQSIHFFLLLHSILSILLPDFGVLNLLITEICVCVCCVHLFLFFFLFHILLMIIQSFSALCVFFVCSSDSFWCFFFFSLCVLRMVLDSVFNFVFVSFFLLIQNSYSVLFLFLLLVSKCLKQNREK